MIEDNYDYRLVLNSEIGEQDDMDYVDDFGSIPAAMAVLPETPSDILILDPGLPKVDGLDAILDPLAAMWILEVNASRGSDVFLISVYG